MPPLLLLLTAFILMMKLLLVVCVRWAHVISDANVHITHAVKFSNDVPLVIPSIAAVCAVVK